MSQYINNLSQKQSDYTNMINLNSNTEPSNNYNKLPLTSYEYLQEKDEDEEEDDETENGKRTDPLKSKSMELENDIENINDSKQKRLYLQQQQQQQNQVQYPFISLKDIINQCRRIKRSKKVIFDAQDLRYDVIKEVIKVIFQWEIIQQAPEHKEDWYIQWIDGYIYEEDFKKMLPFQKINHFLGSQHLAKKNYLAQNLMKLQKLYPEEYNFFPKTWTLPQQFEDFKKFSEMSKNRKKFYIVKPESSCQGRGIFLMKRNEQVNPNDHVIIQEYINNPCLIDGLKFDFRIYVLLKSINPLRIYMYPEGLTRLATTVYEEPTKQNIQNLTMHLTNYAVNKKNSDFQYNECENEDNKGHKRSFSAALKELQARGEDIHKLYLNIQQIIVKTIISAQPYLSHQYKQYQPKEKVSNMCFEILGFDIMIDKYMKPYLIEVNHSPSFQTDSPLDLQIKRHLIIDTFNILNLSTKHKKYYLETKQQYKKQQPVKLCPSRHGAQIEEEVQQQLQEMYEFEENHRGSYQLIYPNPDDPLNYNRFFEGAKRSFPDLHRQKKSLLEPVLPRQRYIQQQKEQQEKLKNALNSPKSIQQQQNIINMNKQSHLQYTMSLTQQYTFNNSSNIKYKFQQQQQQQSMRQRKVSQEFQSHHLPTNKQSLDQQQYQQVKKQEYYSLENNGKQQLNIVNIEVATSNIQNLTYSQQLGKTMNANNNIYNNYSSLLLPKQQSSQQQQIPQQQQQQQFQQQQNGQSSYGKNNINDIVKIYQQGNKNTRTFYKSMSNKPKSQLQSQSNQNTISKNQSSSNNNQSQLLNYNITNLYLPSVASNNNNNSNSNNVKYINQKLKQIMQSQENNASGKSRSQPHRKPNMTYTSSQKNQKYPTLQNINRQMSQQ